MIDRLQRTSQDRKMDMMQNCAPCVVEDDEAVDTHVVVESKCGMMSVHVQLVLMRLVRRHLKISQTSPFDEIGAMLV